MNLPRAVSCKACPLMQRSLEPCGCILIISSLRFFKVSALLRAILDTHCISRAISAADAPRLQVLRFMRRHLSDLMHRFYLARLFDQLAVKPLAPLLALLMSLSLAACGGDGEVGAVVRTGSSSGSSTTGLTVAIASNDDLLWCGISVYCPAWSVIPFNANLQTAPVDGAYLIGTVRLEVVGNGLSSVALLRDDTSNPPIALFNIAPSGTYAWLDLDTLALQDGQLDVKINAFSIRPNAPGALVITVMEPRTWIIRNGIS